MRSMVTLLGRATWIGVIGIVLFGMFRVPLVLLVLQITALCAVVCYVLYMSVVIIALKRQKQASAILRKSWREQWIGLLVLVAVCCISIVFRKVLSEGVDAIFQVGLDLLVGVPIVIFLVYLPVVCKPVYNLTKNEVK